MLLGDEAKNVPGTIKTRPLRVAAKQVIDVDEVEFRTSISVVICGTILIRVTFVSFSCRWFRVEGQCSIRPSM